MTGPRSGYTGPDYGTHHHQWRELLERWGYLDPDDLLVEQELDNQRDLEAERRGDDRPFGMTARARSVNTTNLRMAA